MPFRSTSLLDQPVGDNTTVTEQAPQVKSDSTKTQSQTQEWKNTPASSITSNVAIYRRGFADDNRVLYAFGDGLGNLYVTAAEDGSTVNSTTAQGPADEIVYVEPIFNDTDPPDLIAVSIDGSIYRMDVGDDTEDWSVSLGGTPNNYAAVDGTDVYVGQPSGQSDEFYKIDGTKSGGSKTWTYSANGHFGGGVVVDDTYVYAVGGEEAFRINKDSGSEDWAVSLDSTGTTYENHGKLALDNDRLYAALNAGKEHLLSAVDISDGSVDWDNKQSGSGPLDDIRTHVVQDSDYIYSYPRKDGGLEKWTKNGNRREFAYTKMDPNGDSGLSVRDVGLTDLGGVVACSLGPGGTGPGDVVAVRKDDGSESFNFDVDDNATHPLGSDRTFLAVGDSAGNTYQYNVATTGTLGPVEVGSRPFLTVGCSAADTFDVLVKGHISQNGTKLTQERLTLEDGDDSVQVPWWSWRWCTVEIDDSMVQAGDVDLFLSASR